jgi:protein-tyrosine-phosphatase
MPAADRIYNVLFLCTGNWARSILGEAVLNHAGNGRFRGFSAGSTPKGQTHPMTLNILHEAGIPTDGLRSKSWEEFAEWAHQEWISSSLSVTTPRARPARSGRVSR